MERLLLLISFSSSDIFLPLCPFYSLVFVFIFRIIPLFSFIYVIFLFPILIVLPIFHSHSASLLIPLFYFPSLPLILPAKPLAAFLLLTTGMERTIPYYLGTIYPDSIAQNKSVLIASSENAIRGLLMHLCEVRTVQNIT